MFLFKIFLLASIALLLNPIKVASEDSTIIHPPIDPYSLKDGINIYPPRPHRPSKDNTSISSTFSLAHEHLCPYTPNDSQALLHSIEKVVNSFYSKNYDKIHIRSGGIGLGALKGQLNYLLGKREDKFSPKLKELLEQLQIASGSLALKVLDQSVASATNTFSRFGAQTIRNNTNVLQARFRDWNSFDKITKHFSEFKHIGDEEQVVSPDFSCLIAMVKDCTITQPCQKIYLTDIHSQYMLMHQVMYQQFAERRSCITLNQDAFGNAQEYRDRLCAKAYMEAEFLESRDFPTRYIDLFAEQVGFCGLLGYPNFMRADYLREILSWQIPSKSGCITDLYGEKRTTDTVEFVNVDDDGVQEPCLVHLTSVSLMAMAVNLRYMVDVCPPHIFD